MTSSLETLSRDAEPAEVARAIDQAGGVIVKGMIDEATLSSFLNDLDPYLARVPFGEEGFSGSKTKRCSALLAKSLTTADLMMAPCFLGAADRLLRTPGAWSGANTPADQAVITPSIQLCVTQLIQLWPGQPAQELHRDDGMFYTSHPGPPVLVQTLIAGSRFTEENGATRVVPGSHRWDDARRPTIEESIPVEMEAGSALIYQGGLYHGGGANRSANETRTAIAISYCPGYLRQEENQYLAVPLERVMELPREVQELMGYKVCPPFCGWVEMQEPLDWLADGSADVASATARFLS